MQSRRRNSLKKPQQERQELSSPPFPAESLASFDLSFTTEAIFEQKVDERRCNSWPLIQLQYEQK